MILESPTDPTVQQEVDRTHKGARVSLRPFDHVMQGRTMGHYRVSARSGVLTAAGIVANAPLFSLRWTDPSALLVLLYLEAFYIPTVAFTAAQELGLEAILASAFTASDSAGTQIVLGTGNRMRRNTMQPSSGIGDLRIGSTTLLTAGTRTLDGNGFAVGGGLVNVVNPAAGTAYVNPGGGPVPFGFRYEPYLSKGEHPIVLTQNEGLIVRNTVAFPAAGAATLCVNLGWAEVAEL